QTALDKPACEAQSPQHGLSLKCLARGSSSIRDMNQTNGLVVGKSLRLKLIHFASSAHSLLLLSLRLGALGLLAWLARLAPGGNRLLYAIFGGMRRLIPALDIIPTPALSGREVVERR